MKSAKVDGGIVKVGDSVGFKSDYEQYGTVIDIKTSNFGKVLVIESSSEDGFGGDYLQGATVTSERAERCWID